MMRVNGFLSEQHSSCAEPLLHILCANDCRSQHRQGSILKFSDDTVIISLLHNDKSEQGPVEFLQWCDEAFLQFDAAKDIVSDFRRKSSHPKELALNLWNIINISEQNSH